jgi:hypothetical protein
LANGNAYLFLLLLSFFSYRGRKIAGEAARETDNPFAWHKWFIEVIERRRIMSTNRF